MSSLVVHTVQKTKSMNAMVDMIKNLRKKRPLGRVLKIHMYRIWSVVTYLNLLSPFSR